MGRPPPRRGGRPWDCPLVCGVGGRPRAAPFPGSFGSVGAVELPPSPCRWRPLRGLGGPRSVAPLRDRRLADVTRAACIEKALCISIITMCHHTHR